VIHTFVLFSEPVIVGEKLLLSILTGEVRNSAFIEYNAVSAAPEQTFDGFTVVGINGSPQAGPRASAFCGHA
jgi:hypothetical protein